MGILRRDTQRIFRTLQSQHFLNVFIKILRLGGRGETLYYAAVLRDKEFSEVPEDVPLFLRALAYAFEHGMSGLGLDAFVFLVRGLRLKVFEDWMGLRR